MADNCQGIGRTVAFGGRATAVASLASATINLTVSTPLILQCVEVPPIQGPNYTVTAVTIGDLANIVTAQQTVTGGTAGAQGIPASMFSPYATCTNIVKGLCVGVGVPVIFTATNNSLAATILEVGYQGQTSACGMGAWDPALSGSPQLGSQTGAQIAPMDLSGRIQPLGGQPCGRSPRGRVVAFGGRATAIAAAASCTINLTVSTPLTLMCVEVPPIQGPNYTVTDVTVGDLANLVTAQQTVTNGTAGAAGVNGTLFSPYATCTNVVRGLCVGVGVPVIFKATNNSGVANLLEVGYTGITSNC